MPIFMWCVSHRTQNIIGINIFTFHIEWRSLGLVFINRLGQILVLLGHKSIVIKSVPLLMKILKHSTDYSSFLIFRDRFTFCYPKTSTLLSLGIKQLINSTSFPGRCVRANVHPQMNFRTTLHTFKPQCFSFVWQYLKNIPYVKKHRGYPLGIESNFCISLCWDIE